MLTVKLSNGQSKEIAVPSFDIPLVELKALIASVADIPAEEQRIVFRGKILKDDQNVASCGIADGTAVHVVRTSKSNNASTVSASAAATQAPPPAPPTPIPSTANPYAALFQQPSGTAPQSVAWPGTAGSSGEQQMMSTLMNNPVLLQQSLQMMQQNPALLENIFQNHPLLQGMPPAQRAAMMQMMSNPQFMQMALAMAPQVTAPANGPPNLAGLFSNPAQTVPAAQRYAAQLEQLRNMGFPNESANIQALEMSGGNVEFAVARLLGE